MPTVTVTENAGTQVLLAHLLLHQSADAPTLAKTLGRDETRIARSLSRLARRGLVTVHDGRYEIVSHRRTDVADYAEGALSLVELARAAQ
ncbi:MAG TPA: helix-turn-helix domain-containing protein [Chloroflexota bacterium]|jgi:predicted transcriptional regulator|nr:helix-turn-helix domain-containing protein [Chloroflexota bacterium]